MARRYPYFLLLCFIGGFPQMASAHLVSTRFGEFYSGLLHPLTTLLHLVPWLAFGLVAGMQKIRLARWSLVVFPVSVFIGVVIGAALGNIPLLKVVNIVTFAAGLLAALAISLPDRLFFVLFVFFGVSHGVANAANGLAGGPLFLYAGGAGVAAYLLLTITTATTYGITQRVAWGEIAARALGSWIIAIGLLYGGYELLVQS